jgi:kinesin family protein 4/21/27
MQDQKLNRRFRFDHVFDEGTQQSEIYETLKVDQMIDKVISGFNSTIFAYGQTGSGKTFTLEGYSYDLKLRPIITSDDRIGLIPRAIRGLFSKIKSFEGSVEYTVYVNFVQIYRENIFDLLNPANRQGGLKMRWNKQDEFYVVNLYSYPCYDPEEVLNHYHRGLKNKIMASHNLNSNSSRSHCIFSLTVEALDKSGRILKSKLQIVDLAGSEKISQTGNEGIMLKESIEINKALFTLRQVITSLSSGDSHVPYRDSKLTSLLKQSIGGNSYCLMIACLSPADDYLEENLSTLEYATKAGCISNEPVKNVDPKTRVIKDLKREVKKLKKDLNQAEKHVDLLTELVTLDKNSQLARLREVEEKSRKVGHVQRIKALRSAIEEAARTSGSFKIASPINSFSDNSRLAESMQIIKDLRQENAALKQALGQKNQVSSMNSYEITQTYNENRKLREKVEMMERKLRKFEVSKESTAEIYSDRLYIEPRKVTQVKSKSRRRKPPTKSREDFFMYEEKKQSVTQPIPEYSQTAQPIRPITQEFPQSKEDAIKALSQLLLSRARAKTQTFT